MFSTRDAPSGAPPRTPSAKPSFHSFFRLRLPIFMAGGLGGAVTPVPFPNTDVKGPRGDGTTPRSVGEQRAAGLLLKAPSLSTEAGGLFLFRAARRRRPSPYSISMSPVSMPRDPCFLRGAEPMHLHAVRRNKKGVFRLERPSFLLLYCFLLLCVFILERIIFIFLGIKYYDLL